MRALRVIRWFGVVLALALGAAGAVGSAAPQAAREHWSFKPPVRPEVPQVKNSGWVRNPIDAFVSTEHEKHGLTPRPEAPKHVLLRRVYLDLIGLPPTRDQLHAFLDDKSTDA